MSTHDSEMISHYEARRPTALAAVASAQAEVDALGPITAPTVAGRSETQVRRAIRDRLATALEHLDSIDEALAIHRAAV